MSIIERYRKEQESKDIKKYEESPEGVPPSTSEILQDPELSELLNLILERDEEHDQNLRTLREELLKGETLSEDEFEKINKYRGEIKQAKDSTREVLELLTEERIKIIAVYSDSFRNLVGHLGTGRVKSFLENYFTRLIILNPNNFKELQDKLKGITEAEDRLRSIDGRLQDLAKQYNLPEEELSLVISNKASLEDLIKRNLSSLGKIRNWLGEKGWIGGRKFVKERAGELYRIDDINNQIALINNNLKEIGDMIAGTVFASEKGREYLSQAIRGNMEKPQEISFAQASKELPSEEELKKDFERFLRENEYLTEGETWGSLDEERKFQLREEYLRRKRGDRKGGLFDFLFGMIEKLAKNI